MKINLIESFCNQYVGFVRVVAEDGSFGCSYPPTMRILKGLTSSGCAMGFRPRCQHTGDAG